MTMKYNAVIFDLDGTLTDSAGGILHAVEYALNKIGKPLPGADTLRRFLGPPLAESFTRWCGMTEEEAKQATAFYREQYFTREGWRENAVYPGIRLLLRMLKKKRVFLAVATGKPANCTIPILKEFGLFDFFDAVACPDEKDFHADKAELIRRVLPLGCESALMVGDIPADLEGADRAGVDACAALWGYGDRADMMMRAPVLACESPRELKEALMPGENERGFFISFEGVDGCGKTTQQKLLAEKLTSLGYETVLTREPGGCPIAEEIRKIVLAKEDLGMCPETEALLFAAARAQHVKEKILPAVNEGKIVLCDRYVDSSLAYQAIGRGLGEEWVRAVNRPALTWGLPDMTCYLRMDARDALARRAGTSEMDRIEKSGEEFFRASQAAFDALAEKEKDRYTVIDAAGTPDEIASTLAGVLLARLREAEK